MLQLAIWGLNHGFLFLLLMIALGVLGIVLRKVNGAATIVYAIVMFVILHGVFSSMNTALCMNMGYGLPTANEQLSGVFLREFLGLDSTGIMALFEFGWDALLFISIICLFFSGVPMCYYAILTGLLVMHSPVITILGTAIAWIVGIIGAGFLAYFAVILLVVCISVPGLLLAFFI